MAIATSTLLGIAAGVSAAGSLASAGAAIKKATKGPPSVPVEAPSPPPPVPPVPATPPPAALDTGEDAAVDKDKRKRSTKFGIAQTLLASPLGARTSSTGSGSTLIGG